MGRHGIGPDDVAGFVEEAVGYRGARLAGVFSHLSSADEEDLTYTRLQISKFVAAVDAIEAAGHPRIVRHVANSAGTLLHTGLVVRHGKGRTIPVWHRSVLQGEGRSNSCPSSR